MIKMFDRLFLFIYSLCIAIVSAVAVFIGFRWIVYEDAGHFLEQLYNTEAWRYTLAIVGIIFFLISLRFVAVTFKRSGPGVPSIDQRTDFGDIRISLDTVENLSLKSASRVKGVKDLKTRVKVSEQGLEIVIRALVDGEISIPQLTEEVQRSVKEHVEHITGIPVSQVTVFVANIVHSNTIKSRVE